MSVAISMFSLSVPVSGSSSASVMTNSGSVSTICFSSSLIESILNSDDISMSQWYQRRVHGTATWPKGNLVL